jgi:uncharacterized protein with von Willebrand factor type A (vWA) domain
MEKAYPDVLFYEFFMALRAKGLDLGINQYDWFLQVFLQSAIQTEAQLLNLFKTVWLTRPSFQQEFEQLFEMYFRKTPDKFLPAANIGEPKPAENVTSAKSDRQKKPDTTNEKPKDDPQENKGNTQSQQFPTQTFTPEPDVEMWLSIDTGVSEGSNPVHQAAGSLMKTEYIFNDAKHLPFAVRKTGQTLRKIHTRIIYETTNRLHFQAIIKQRVQDGFVHQLIYEKQKRGVQEIIWLSDHSNTNLPYEPWSNALRKIVADCPSVEKVHQYFYHLYPTATGDDFKFFENRAQTTAILLSDMLRKCTKHTIVIIFSDAGAARQRFDAEQLQILFALTNAIRNKTKRFVWLNPVQRLSGTTAGYLSLMIPMRYPNQDDIRRFVNEL